MMKLHRRIKALLFLTIMSLFTAHNALPHAHHSSTSHVEDHEHIDHHHHHSHDHSHEKEPHDTSDNAENFLLALLLDTHAHSSHTHVYLTLTEAVNKANKISVTLFMEETTSQKFLLPPKKPDKQRQNLFETIYYYNPSLHHYPLRAPPFLG